MNILPIRHEASVQSARERLYSTGGRLLEGLGGAALYASSLKMSNHSPQEAIALISGAGLMVDGLIGGAIQTHTSLGAFIEKRRTLRQ